MEAWRRRKKRFGGSAVRRYWSFDAIYARHLPDVEPEDTRQHATSFLIQYSLPQAKDCRQQLEQQQVSTSPTKGLTDNKNTSKTVRLTAGCCGSRYVVAFFCITNQIISFWRWTKTNNFRVFVFSKILPGIQFLFQKIEVNLNFMTNVTTLFTSQYKKNRMNFYFSTRQLLHPMKLKKKQNKT